MTTGIPQVTAATEIKTAVRHSFVYGLGNVLAKALGFCMIPFYTHYLTPRDYGVLEILDLSMSLLGMFLAMGMTAAMLRSYVGAKTEQERHRIVGTAFVFVLGTGLGTFLLMLTVVRQVSVMVVGPDTPPTYLLTAFSSFIVGYIANVPRTYLRAREASGAFVTVETVGLLVMLVLNVIFIVSLKMGAFGILLSSVLVGGAQLLVLSVWMLRGIRIHFDMSLLSKMLAFGFPLMFSNMAVFALNFSDRFFLQHLRGLEVVGVYAVGYKFAFMLNYLVVQPFMIMWQTRMYVIHQNSEHRSIFSQIFVLYSVLLIYAGLAMAVLSPELVRIMVGPQFGAGQNVIPIVTLAYVFYGIGYYLELGMLLKDRSSLVGAVGAGAAILNLGLNYVLVLHFGMMGAAWATLASFLGIAVASYWLSERVLPLSLGAGRVTSTVLFAISLYLVARFWTPASVGATVTLKLFLLAAFPWVLWKTNILSTAEKSTLISAGTTIRERLSSWTTAVSGIL